MALDAMSSNDMLNFLIYDTIYGNPLKHIPLLQENHSILDHPTLNGIAYNTMLPSQDANVPMPPPPSCFHKKREISRNERAPNLATQAKKKRRRRPKICKNKEEAETQRMAHIAVERNRRKQMNQHLSVLRSLMPQSYAQKGDQASIVGGAIEYVKELEHLLQSLKTRKFILLQKEGETKPTIEKDISTTPFAESFSSPQYTLSQSSTKCGSACSVADIEVNLIESHANIRILMRRSSRQLSKMVAGFQLLHLCILHLNVTSFNTLVLYTINAKIEEGCELTSVDEIANATNHMLRVIEDEVALC